MNQQKYTQSKKILFYIHVHLLFFEKKSEIKNWFKMYKNMIKNKQNRKLKIIRFDNKKIF